MRLSLKSVGTILRRFRSLLCGKSEKRADVCASAEASGKSRSLSKEERAMIKVGEKVLVHLKVTQIVEDGEGTHYVVGPDGKRGFCNTIRVEKEDIHQCQATERESCA